MDFNQISLFLLTRLIGNAAEKVFSSTLKSAKEIANDASLGSDVKKRNALVKKIKVDSKVIDINLKDSVINLMAELAVSIVKREN
jgi:hypothetical protein